MDAPSPRIVGYWRAAPPAELLGLPDPAALVAPGWEAARRDPLIAYLRAGRPRARYAVHASCRFAACRHPARARLGDTDLTDGDWIWPEGLWHYVRDHDVRLPDELVEAAADRGFRVPPAARDDAERAPDAGFWLRWSAEHTAPAAAAADACTLDDARALCAALSTRRWHASLAAARGRWQLTLATDGAALTDFTEPIADATLRRYLFAARRADDDAVLSPRRAAAIARAITGPARTVLPFARTTGGDGRAWWAVISSGVHPTRALAELDLHAIALPEPGGERWLPGPWKVEVVPAMDELAWRFFVDQRASP